MLTELIWSLPAISSLQMEQKESYQYDFAISYAGEEESIAKGIHDSIKERYANYSIFFAPKELDKLVGQDGERSNIALTKDAIDRNNVLLNRTVDGIFKKANELNENGLPSYSGPFNTRSGNFNHQKRTVTWME